MTRDEKKKVIREAIKFAEHFLAGDFPEAEKAKARKEIEIAKRALARFKASH